MTRAIVLFGHGSRDPAWRQPMDAVAARIRASAPAIPAECAFLELQEPSLQQAVDGLVAAGATRISVLPMFLGVGKHAREDLPRLVAQVRSRHPLVDLDVRRSAGEEVELLDLLAALALR